MEEETEESELVINEVLNKGYAVFQLAWLFVDEQEIGGYLGQTRGDGLSEKPPAEADDWEHWAASKAVRDLPNTGWSRDAGFFWESIKDARYALKTAKAALGGKPYPEWALKALAEGWKPPKGWKP